MRSFLSILCVVFIMGAAGAAAQDALPWTLRTIYPLSSTPGAEGGPGVRIAIDALTQRPVVAFLADVSEPASEVAILWDHPIGPSDGWRRIGYDLGHPLSDLDMDVWSSPTQWKVGISLRNQSDDSLHFVETVFDRAGGTPLTTDMMIRDETSFRYGIGTSVVYDASGTPHVAAHVRPVFVGTPSLMYATRVASGGNCGVGAQQGKWACTTVHAGTEAGRDPTITLDGAGLPVIAYTAQHSDDNPVDLVFVARPTISGAGSCGSGYWNCGYVDSETLFADQSRPALLFDASAAGTGLHVAFLSTSHYTVTPTTARHAVWVGGGGGDCGYPAHWDCGDSITDFGIDSIALGTDQAGRAILAYATAGLLELGFAEYLGTNWSGNCGYLDRWSCGALEPDIGLVDEMGQWIDLAVDASGQPQVVFSKFLHTAMTSQVRLAYPWVFRDGFESGDRAAWNP